MRSSKSRSRSKSNRQRSVGNIINRVFDSSGPEGKVRGTPQQIIDKYLMLARDAQLGNDRVAEQNFLQHAEHYTRMLGEAQRELAREQESRQAEQQARQQERNEHRDNRGERNGNGNERVERPMPDRREDDDLPAASATDEQPGPVESADSFGLPPAVDTSDDDPVAALPAFVTGEDRAPRSQSRSRGGRSRAPKPNPETAEAASDE